MSESSFSERLQRTDAFRLFMAALPRVSAECGRPVHLVFEATEEGVECNVGFQGASESEFDTLASTLLNRLEKTERHQRLTLLVDELRQAGVSPGIIEKLSEEANEIIASLYPELASRLVPTPPQD